MPARSESNLLGGITRIGFTGVVGFLNLIGIDKHVWGRGFPRSG